MELQTSTSTKQPTGYVVWEGPSLIDGAPIVAIALTHSSNRKTGDMVQTYILRQDVKPTEALRTGADASICGDCKHRPSTGGACYVVVAQGPTVVWKGYRAGRYPGAGVDQLAQLGAGRMVRLGTYGDPAAVPAWVWEALVSRASGRTGYTHQWARMDRPTVLGENVRALRPIVMASVDTEAELRGARRAGWRTFRILVPGEMPRAGEFTCPASEEAGKVRTCATCGACDGAQRGTLKASPAIVVHGTKARRFVSIIAA